MTGPSGWRSSGLQALSGPPPGGQTGPPERLVAGVKSLTERIARASAALALELGTEGAHQRHGSVPSSAVALEGLMVLAERASLEGLAAGGRISCGGATRMLPCADGWLALSLARPTDEELVPAWLALAGGDIPDGSALGSDRSAVLCERSIGEAVASLPGRALVEAAELLGLPVGLLGERAPDRSGGVSVTRFGAAAGRDPEASIEPGHRRPGSMLPSLRVVDLSALWAGPLCGSLLARAGAEVVKVESTTRPDAGRIGSPNLHERLNGAKAERTIDLDAAGGRDELAALIVTADVVIESARPRALEHLGIVAADELARPDGPQVWVSITGHGRTSRRVAFGDDAAVAGGLVVTTDEGPWFCGDAIADPLSGLAAAAAALELLAAGERGLIDVAMAGVAAAHAGPTVAAP